MALVAQLRVGAGAQQGGSAEAEALGMAGMELSWQKRIPLTHGIRMYATYGLPFTINFSPIHVSINIPYIRIRHGL